MGVFSVANKDALNKFRKNMSERFGAKLGKQAMAGIDNVVDFSNATKGAQKMWMKNVRAYEESGQGRMNYSKDQNIPFYNSACIERVVYQPDQKVAFVKFNSGDTVYSYPNVSKSEMTGWTKAASKGKYFWHKGIQKKGETGFRAEVIPELPTTTMYKQYGSFGYWKPPHGDSVDNRKQGW